MLILQCQKKYAVDAWIDFKEVKRCPNQILELKDLKILKGKVTPDELSSEETLIIKEALINYRKFKSRNDNKKSPTMLLSASFRASARLGLRRASPTVRNGSSSGAGALSTWYNV